MSVVDVKRVAFTMLLLSVSGLLWAQEQSGVVPPSEKAVAELVKNQTVKAEATTTASNSDELAGNQTLNGETEGSQSEVLVDVTATVESTEYVKPMFGFMQTRSLSSKVLEQERGYKVYLPPSYYAKPKYNYPVLYLIDGDYNFLSIASMVENLSKGSNPLIPEIMVVGISAKGVEAYRNNMKPAIPLGKGGDADDFQEFVRTELKPEINKNYRTSGFDILQGQSIGGLYVVNNLLTSGEDFSAYIAISPMMWWEDYRLESKAKSLLEKITPPAKKLYLSLANEPRMGVYGLLEQLDRNRPAGVDWSFKHFKDENHDSVTMPALRYALKDLFSGWYISYKELASYRNFDEVRDHYLQYFQRFNLQQAIPAFTYKALMHQYPKEQKAEKAAALYLQTTQHLSLSLIDLRNHLSALAIKEKEYDKAGELLQQSFKENANDFSVQRAMAKWYKAQKQWPQAEEAAAKALDLAEQQWQRDWQLMILADELAEIKEQR